MIIVREFICSGLIVGACVWLVFLIYSGDILKSFVAGLLCGVSLGGLTAIYLTCMLFLFKNRLLFYGNVEKKLAEVGISHIVFGGIAGNTTRGLMKQGSLFLSSDFVVFVPQRFAMKSSLIKLPLNAIARVAKVGITFSKFFYGGLWKRLLIETNDGVRYEFSVWELDRWVREIAERIK